MKLKKIDLKKCTKPPWYRNVTFLWCLVAVAFVFGFTLELAHMSTQRFFTSNQRDQAAKALFHYQVDASIAEYAWKSVKVFNDNNEDFRLAKDASDKARESRLKWEKLDKELQATRKRCRHE